MAKNVQMPDGSVVEFPDTMSNDDIGSVIQKTQIASGAARPQAAGAPPPKGTLPNGGDTGEGPIAQGLTTMESHLADMPKSAATLLLAKHWPVIDAKNYSELGQDLKSLNPIATDEGSLPMNIGATAANLLPLAVGGQDIAETAVPATVRGVAKGTNTLLDHGGALGAAAGAAVGHATGIPFGGLIGTKLGYDIGKSALSKVRVPGERFGLPPAESTLSDALPLQQAASLPQASAPSPLPLQQAAAPAADLTPQLQKSVEAVQAKQKVSDLADQLQTALGQLTKSQAAAVAKKIDPLMQKPYESLGHVPMEPADSSMFSKIGYNPTTKDLVTEFSKDGAVYHHQGVPAELADAYKNADSQGKFYGANIRGKFGETLKGYNKKR